MKMEWQAEWIWNKLPEGTPNVYLEARKSFVLDAEPLRANLFLSANQEYLVYLNGNEIGRGPSPSDQQWKYYDEYEVGEYLHKGENVLAVVTYNFGTKDIVTGQMQGPGGVLAELAIESAASVLTIATDSAWKVRRSPRWVEQVSRQHQWGGFREIYRVDREDGWQQVDYDDTSWEHAVVVERPGAADARWPRLLPREIPPLHRELLKPQAVVRTDANFGGIEGEENLLASSEPGSGMKLDASKPGSLPGALFDYGKEVVGYPELDVEASQGGIVQLWYGESLDLELYDTFLLKGGQNQLKPFGRRAFRFLYVTVQAAASPVTISRLETESVHYDFDPAGTFRCSDPLLNRIWEIGTYTTMVNSQEHLEDCPLREKALWVADAVVMGKVIYHVFGEERLLRKCLLQGARIQNVDGSIPGTGPERNAFLLPDFNAHWLFGVYQHWLFTRDGSFVSEVWPAVDKLMDWFHRQEDEEGLFARADRPGWWCFIDWAEYIDRRDRVTAMSCFYYKALRTASELAGAAGKPSRAAEWLQRSERLRQTIRETMRVPGFPVFADCIGPDGLSSTITAQTNFAAIWCGVMEEEEAARFLEEWFFAGKTPALKGAFFYHIVLECLIRLNRAADALGLMRSYWGGMIERGATTWWETFDPSTPACTVPSPYQGNTPTYLMDHIPVSHCHGWGASPTYVLTQSVLGIDVSRSGNGEIRFDPHPGNLEWAEGSVPTRYGPIHAAWKKAEDGVLDCELTVPASMKVVLSGRHRVAVRRGGVTASE
ncbi:hypothetical protein J31TS4_27580 [Paenibacillus sp. J31TS4]|uniref:alpha-L-rhamnosidase-related protein n=1 Tax=Paenibacillus sp. J31TS4 TaxID=2807195 RepID=UPI001B0D1518|nr:alpha-L-rhamnosidase N-terminal domain-containing protein [Paenibacillus sp. J31TS4]GIP39478.1 hypothetical protein J31TS4_27580 [Paenibacillus sp. J31TS4]